MKPVVHLVVSFSLSAVIWIFTKSIYGAALCFISGTIIDIDHILDYAVCYGWGTAPFKKLFRASIHRQSCYEKQKFSKVYFLFHSTEVALLLWIIMHFTANIYILSIAVGYSTHLILDYIANQEAFWFYFIIWRIAKKFRADRILRARVVNNPAVKDKTCRSKNF